MASNDAELEKKLRAVKKKLGQIEKLREKGEADLDAAAREKIASEPALRAEAKALEAQIAGTGGAAPQEAAAPAAAVPPRRAGAAPSPPAPPKEEEEEEPARPAPAKKKAAAAAPEEALAAAPAPEPALAVVPAAGPTADQEKRLKAIRKKLQQIERIKEKAAEGKALEPEEKEKVAAEAELLREAAALEGGREHVAGSHEVTIAATETKKASADDGGETAAAEGGKDPHALARAEALEPPPGDVGLLLDDETEKRFKALQKKLRDIGKLREKDKLDKLQQDKLAQEPGLIEEIAVIRAKAVDLVAVRRAQLLPGASAAARKADKAEPQPRGTPLPAWQCLECGAFGGMSDLIGSEGAAACNKCGGTEIKHNAPGRADYEEEEDDGTEEQGEAKAGKKHDSKDLKTARQKKPPPATGKKADAGQPSADGARWPEVREVLQSGEHGVDKSRQRKAIEVSRAGAGAPYDTFDSVLLKCAFLTRVELKLPPGVLSGEGFQLYFPGALAEGLLELILKENELPTVPPGIQQLQRIRSIDLSHNKLASLPDASTWESISGSLELLDLSFNKLVSIAELAPLRKLSQLKVDANQLASLDGVSWGELKQLSNLSAVGNQLEEIPEAVGEHAASLEYLELSDNKITGLPAGICELKKLKTLNIAGNPIKDQKLVKAAEKGLKELKAYLSKAVPAKGKK